MTGPGREWIQMRNTDKVTVAHVMSGLGYGGVEMVVYRYISHMDPEGYHWICISYTTPEEHVRRMFEEKGFQVYRVTSKRENFLKSCLEMWKILRENHVQIVHSHMTLWCFVPNLLGMAAGAEMRISHSHLAMHPRGIQRPVYWFLKKMSKWTATARFACGEEAARFLYGKRGAKNAVIMNNALDWETFRFDAGVRAEMRREYGLTDCTAVGHVACFREQKNHGFLLEVFAEYHRREENSRLILIGDGPLLEQVKAQAGSMGLGESVLFVPPTGRVSRWYMAMDIFVLPSLYEGLCVASVEAQAAGLPAILSDRVSSETALSEYVKFLSLEDGPEVWSREIQKAVRNGRGGDIREALMERHLDIGREAGRLDRFYRQGVWK